MQTNSAPAVSAVPMERRRHISMWGISSAALPCIDRSNDTRRHME
jgi:hypothetical protein